MLTPLRILLEASGHSRDILSVKARIFLPKALRKDCVGPPETLVRLLRPLYYRAQGRRVSGSALSRFFVV